MSHYEHHAIVVISGDESAIKSAHGVVVAMGAMPTEIAPPLHDGFWAFLIHPNGSRFTAHSLRNQIAGYLDSQALLDWVEVAFGEDGAEVVRPNSIPKPPPPPLGYVNEDELRTIEMTSSERSIVGRLVREVQRLRNELRRLTHWRKAHLDRNDPLGYPERRQDPL